MAVRTIGAARRPLRFDRLELALDALLLDGVALMLLISGTTLNEVWS